MSLFFKKKKNSNTESELLIFANESNEKVITNSMLKEQIFQHETFINKIKRIFELIDNKKPKNKNTMKELLKNSISQELTSFINQNSKLKNEISNLQIIHNRKLEDKNDSISGLVDNLDKLKEDNFILDNSIKEKQSHITILKDQIKLIKNNNIQKFEKHLMYGRKFNEFHEKELTKYQTELAKISKDHNQEILKSNKLNKEYKNLKNELSHVRLNTEKISPKINIKFEDKIEEEENEEDYINRSLIFNDFENEDDLSLSLNFSQDETYINYSLDFNDNNLNISQSNDIVNNVNNIDFPYYKKKERNFVSDYKEPKFGIIPKLNLKQIEFNKIRVITENFDELSGDDNKKNQIKKNKKDIEREKKKKEKLKMVISNFKSYYKKIKIYIKQLKLQLVKSNIKNVRCNTDIHLDYI